MNGTVIHHMPDLNAPLYGANLLSHREQCMVALVAQGLKNHEAATQLGIRPMVFKNYLKVIYDKLGVWNRIELALWYEKQKEEQKQ